MSHYRKYNAAIVLLCAGLHPTAQDQATALNRLRGEPVTPPHSASHGMPLAQTHVFVDIDQLDLFVIDTGTGQLLRPGQLTVFYPKTGWALFSIVLCPTVPSLLPFRTGGKQSC